jgi:SAM-dependent methyltransferase
MSDSILHREGRGLFGLDPDGYDAARPPYPAAIWRFLRNTGALRSSGALRRGTATLEIGAGSGLATRRLIEHGAYPLTVVEPDARFAPLLRTLAEASATDVRLIGAAFEDVELPDESFELVVAATSFHWLEPRVRLAKIARLLRSGGCVALWWNVFGDPHRTDPFHDATRTLLADLAVSPSGAPEEVPFPLDRSAIEAEFAHSGRFGGVAYAEMRWTLTLDTVRVGKLYESFSHIQRLPPAERDELLERLTDTARMQFGGTVVRNMTTPLYLARRLD